MSIEALLALVPSTPLDDDDWPGIQYDWNIVEDELGMALPDDYQEFIECYGFVRLDDFLMVYSPFAPRGPGNLLDQLSLDLDAYRTARTGREAEMPLAPLPEPGGLLPLGRTDNGDQLFWLTVGTPNAWPIILIAEGDRRHERIEMSITRFLAALITDDIDVVAFPPKFPRSSPAFTRIDEPASPR
jgi:SMI1-KNR4 cell-wall